jgi:hypothetical protein
MQAVMPQPPMSARPRAPPRAAALVLVLFLAGIAFNVACADHDLADAGIGQHQSHMPAPDGAPSSGDSPAHVGGHCCHASGVHVPALLASAAVLPFDSSTALSFYDEPARPSALDQRELRPPIL